MVSKGNKEIQQKCKVEIDILHQAYTEKGWGIGDKLLFYVCMCVCL